MRNSPKLPHALAALSLALLCLAATPSHADSRAYEFTALSHATCGFGCSDTGTSHACLAVRNLAPYCLPPAPVKKPAALPIPPRRHPAYFRKTNRTERARL